MKPLISLCLSAALAATAAPSEAAVRALLVGVSDYLYLDADLRGPANDVRLMAETLGRRGAERITVLADPAVRLPEGLAAPVAPTRTAILTALAALADEAEAGDTVVFYFSGHGAQAPDRNGDEARGYDEILLPADAKGWRGAYGDVENAIVDDEFQPLFQAILDTGATLVAVLDACHSATGFRAVTSGAAAERFVGPAVLGLPDALAPGPGEADQIGAPLQGDFVFLYSSQSDQRSFEFPLGDPADPANWHGAFTAALSGVLGAAQEATWEQVLHGAADAMQRGDIVQTPDGEGSAMAAPVFGAGTATPQRVAFRDGVLSAGLLSGFSKGATVTIHASATDATAIGTATLAEIGATTATLRGDDPLPDHGYAALAGPGLPPAFRIAPPAILDGADHAPLLDALAALSAAGLPEGVVWNAADPHAVPVLVGGALALVGPDGVLDPVGPGSSPRMHAEPARFFEAAARAHRLRRALALAEDAAPAFSFGLGRSAVSVNVEIEPGAPGPDGCAPAEAPQPFDAASAVGDCDRLWLSMTNGSRTAQDVTVLYIDRDFGITALWPEPGLSNRLNFNETQEAGLEIRLPDGRPGREELIVIAVPADPTAPRTVLTALADPVATRAGPGGGQLERFLWAASDPAAASRSYGSTQGMATPTLTRLSLTLTAAPRIP